MSLEHDTPRFTLDQRDEILNLAARLQVQHESTVGVDELFAEAVAAGIDPRFVQEATLRLGSRRRSFRPYAPLLGFALFVVQACGLMLYQHRWFLHGDTGLTWPDFVVSGGCALVLGLLSARERQTRRFVPIAPLAVWVAVGTAAIVLTNLFAGLGFDSYVVPTVLSFAVVQTLASVLAVFAVGAVERRPNDLVSFRLYRPRP